MTKLGSDQKFVDNWFHGWHWVGLTRHPEHPEQWIWYDGEPLTAPVNWSKGSPRLKPEKNYPENYVHFYANQGFVDSYWNGWQDTSDRLGANALCQAFPGKRIANFLHWL